MKKKGIHSSKIVAKFVKFSFQVLFLGMCLNCFGGVLWGRDPIYFLNGCKIAPVGLLSSFTYSVQFSSVAQSCPTLCHPMNRSTSGLPVQHQHPEYIQAHVHQINDAN